MINVVLGKKSFISSSIKEIFIKKKMKGRIKKSIFFFKKKKNSFTQNKWFFF